MSSNKNQASSDTFQLMLRQLRNTFIESVPEKFDNIENLLLAMEKNGAGREAFNEIFRVVHSLKGSGGTYGLHIITTICHQLEDLLNTTEGGERFTPELISLSLSYVDLLRSATEQIRAGEESFPQVEKRLEELRRILAPANFSVLLISDSRLLTSICQQTLAALPVHTILMQDGFDGLMRALTQHFDLIITENEIPRLNGVALVGALRLSESHNRHAKAIIISSNKKLATALKRSTDPDYVIVKDGKLSQNLVEATQRVLAQAGLAAG